MDAARELEKAFRREGLTVYTDTKLIEARRAGAQKEVVFEHGHKHVRVDAEEIFLALGRKANIASLGLEKIGIRIEYGRIVTQLSRFHYERLLSVDIRDIPDAPFAMEPEVRKLKFLLESLV